MKYGSVGDKQMTEGGHYSPRKNEIVVYIDYEPPASMEGIVAHEAAHGLYAHAREELDKQKEEIKRLAAERTDSLHQGNFGVTWTPGLTITPPGLSNEERIRYMNWPHTSAARPRARRCPPGRIDGREM